MNKDAEQLRLLSIFHYVVAGIVALFSLIPLIHITIGYFMLTAEPQNPEKDVFVPIVGGFLMGFGAFAIILGLTFTVCLVLAGRRLTQHKQYMFCLVMAAITCTFMPFGTVLGVFTIVVLQRDSVRQLFGRVSA